ncbi:MAG: hypothetical protein JWM28_2050 [Chitinophagaceae bacterium]|nr:hypothetical protein [Chitinophagaceae bacterium]
MILNCLLIDFVGTILLPVLTTIVGTVAGGWIVLRYADLKQKRGEIITHVSGGRIRLDDRTYSAKFMLDIYNSSSEIKTMRAIAIHFDNGVSPVSKSNIHLTNGSTLTSLNLSPKSIVTKDCLVPTNLKSIGELDIYIVFHDEQNREQKKKLQDREKDDYSIYN